MLQYEQNSNLSYIQQQERIDEGERSRLAMDANPTTRSFGSLFIYALRKLKALEQALKAQPEAVNHRPPQPRKST